MKRFLAAVAGASLLLLAGCGSSTPSTGSGGTATGASASSSGSQSLQATAKKLFPHGITVIVGFGTGGAVDTGARLMAPYLHQVLGVPIVVQNMPGAGSATAAHYVASQKPDGSVLLMTFIPPLTVSQVIGGGNFDERSLTPIYGIYGHNTTVVLAKKGSKYTNYTSLQNASSTITAGVTGVKSSMGWLGLAELAEVNGIHMQPVPFKSGAAASNAALGGSVDLAATTVIEAQRLIKSGKAQGVVEFGPTAYSSLPGIESIAQMGKASEAYDASLGLTAPPNTPQKVVNVLAQALNQVTKNADFLKKANNVGEFVVPRGPAAWSKAIQTSYANIEGIKPLVTKFVPKQ